MRGVLRGVVAACVLAACPPSQPTQAPKPSPLEVRRYAPLAFKADALDPKHAVILGTDDAGGSTLLPLAAAPAATRIDAVGRGGLVAIEVAATPSPSHDATLALPGASPRFRADAWNAVLVATSALHKQPGDYFFSMKPAGALDDVHSSALLASALLATVTGAVPDPSTTLVGSLTSDGSIGPVPGLPELIAAAARAGKRRIGYPLEQRQSRSASGALVDVETIAKQVGVQAIAVGDLYDAYRVLTGAELPRPVPVGASAMAIDAGVTAVLDTKYKLWQQRLAVEWAAILQLESAGRLPSLLSYLRDHSKRFATAAEALKKRGQHGGAYARMFAASLYAATATQAYDILSKVQTNQLDAAIAVLAKHDRLAVTTGDVLAAIGTQSMTTLGGYVQAIAAFRAALRGWVFESFATQALETAKSKIKLLAGKSNAELGSDQIAEQVVSITVPALLYVGKTVADTTLAREQLELPIAGDVPLALAPPAIMRAATAFTAASTASLDEIERLFVEPLAKRKQIALDEARQRVALSDHDYLVAYTLSRLSSGNGAVRSLRDGWGESSGSWSLLAFAAGQLAHADASELLAKYESLQGVLATDGSGQVEKVEHERALASLLVRAETAARACARTAQVATGVIPLQAKLAYENAVVASTGSLDEKIDALAQFWSSSAYSQIAVALARN